MNSPNRIIVMVSGMSPRPYRSLIERGRRAVPEATIASGGFCPACSQEWDGHSDPTESERCREDAFPPPRPESGGPARLEGTNRIAHDYNRRDRYRFLER